MSTKTGFIQCVTARKKKYYYIRRGYRNSNNTVIKENVYKFGRKEQAISQINEWLENFNSIPEHMKIYDHEDFHKWIAYINEKEND